MITLFPTVHVDIDGALPVEKRIERLSWAVRVDPHRKPHPGELVGRVSAEAVCLKQAGAPLAPEFHGLFVTQPDRVRLIGKIALPLKVRRLIQAALIFAGVWTLLVMILTAVGLLEGSIGMPMTAIGLVIVVFTGLFPRMALVLAAPAYEGLKRRIALEM